MRNKILIENGFIVVISGTNCAYTTYGSCTLGVNFALKYKRSVCLSTIPTLFYLISLFLITHSPISDELSKDFPLCFEFLPPKPKNPIGALNAIDIQAE